MRSDLKIYFPQLTDEQLEQLHDLILNVCSKTGQSYDTMLSAIIEAIKPRQ